MKYLKNQSIYVILSLLSSDILSKYISFLYLKDKPLYMINDVFKLQLSYNKGIAFSIPITGWILIIFTIIILGIIIHIRLQEKKTNLFIYWDMVIAGGLGNLFERIMYGKVTDFISILNFPIFNLADSFVFIGICVIIFKSIEKEFIKNPNEKAI